LSAALEYHRRTVVSAPRGWDDEDALRYVGPRPALVKDYGDAQRLPLETSVAGPLLQEGAGVVRSQPGRDYGGGTMHWRAYSSAGALYPVEAYLGEADALYSFDVLSRTLVRIGDGDARAAISAAVDATADTFVVLTGIHRRTGWKYLERGYRHVWWDAGTMLANLLGLAAADGLRPRLYTAFVDRELNELLGVDGVDEYVLAVLGLGNGSDRSHPGHAPLAVTKFAFPETERRFPLAEAAHAASALADVEAVRAWRSEPEEEEPRLGRDELVRAIARRRSIRRYAQGWLPREELAELLAWSEAPVPADVPPVVRQLVTAAAVDGLAPGVYDARLELVRERDERELREDAGLAAMDQEHAGLAAADVFQMADLDAVIARLGDRGYRWAQLEAGIRAGRLQVGAFMRGWGAVASTFFDGEVSRVLETHEAPMLMVAIGPRDADAPERVT
jgi:SagB-type dehydrogenase family enzyme